MSTYNERLIANNQKIDDITTLANTLPDASEIEEKIDEQDTIIENLKSALDEKAGKGGGEPNIFVQLEEPTTKKGIWLQKEAEPEHYTYDEDVFIGGEWEPDGKYATIPFNFDSGKAINVGNEIFLFAGTRVYKYNITTNTYTQLTSGTHSIGDASALCKIGTDIYLFGGNSGSSVNQYSKYDTSTDTWTYLSNTISMPFTCKANPATAVGTNIYVFGGDNNYYDIYKYDTLDNIWTKLSCATTYRTAWGSAVTIGDYAYIIGGNYSYNFPYISKLDPSTNTVTQLNTTIPYIYYQTGATAVGTSIYIFGSNNSTYRKYAYKFDTLTNTWTRLSDIPYNFSNTSAINIGQRIFLLGGPSYPTKVQVYDLENKTYEQDNLVVINQGKYNSIGYEIELYNNSKDIISPKYAFADAWYYTTEGGLETDIPTYYGNGTQWINIKNPPSNETNNEGNIEG